MRRHADRQRIVRTAQPARAGGFDRHQIRDGLRAIVLQSLLFGQRQRLNVARHLLVTGCDQDQALTLRTLLEPEDTPHRTTISRSAAEAKARLSRIGDEPTALEVRGK